MWWNGRLCYRPSAKYAERRAFQQHCVAAAEFLGAWCLNRAGAMLCCLHQFATFSEVDFIEMVLLPKELSPFAYLLAGVIEVPTHHIAQWLDSLAELLTKILVFAEDVAMRA